MLRNATSLAPLVEWIKSSFSTVRCIATRSSKVDLPPAVNFRVLCGSHLVQNRKDLKRSRNAPNFGPDVEWIRSHPGKSSFLQKSTRKLRASRVLKHLCGNFCGNSIRGPLSPFGNYWFPEETSLESGLWWITSSLSNAAPTFGLHGSGF